MGRIKYQEALGLEVKRGRPPVVPAPSKADVVKLYIKEGRSVRDVAGVLGTTKDAVHKALKKYGIKVRTSAKRSRLLKLDQALLFGDIAEIGVDSTARKWSIPERTLKDYLARIKRKGRRK